MKWLKKLFGNDKFDKTASDIEQLVRELKADKDKAEKEAAALRDEKAEEERVRSSNEPWVVIRGHSYDETMGMKVELDWNNAFITYLKQSGYTGPNEDIVVQKWLAAMYSDMASKLEDHVEEGVQRIDVRLRDSE